MYLPDRITDREFLVLLRDDLMGQLDQPVIDRLQLVIDRLDPSRIIAAVRAYEAHILRDLEGDS